MFWSADGLEPNKRNLHGANKAEDVEGGVGGVEAVGEAAHQQ